MKTYKIEQELLQLIVNDLLKRPCGEVIHLVNKLLSLKPEEELVSDAEKKEIDEVLDKVKL